MPEQPLDLGHEPTTLHGFARDIWRMTGELQDDVRGLHARIDSLAGHANGTEPAPASLLGVHSRLRAMEDWRDDHADAHKSTGGRWWTVSLAGFSALIGAFAKELVSRR